MSRMPNQQPDHINETNYNTVLGGLLQSRLPGWKVRPQAARTVSDRGRGSREPDVLAVAPDRAAVAVEAKYLKGNLKLVDRQAWQQVGRTWKGTNIDSAAAVLYPDRLARSTGDYAEALESAEDLRFASWRSGPRRRPQQQWPSALANKARRPGRQWSRPSAAGAAKAIPCTGSCPREVNA